MQPPSRLLTDPLLLRRAVTTANTTVFVKFPCFVGAPNLDASGMCKTEMPPGYETVPDLHLQSIQAVSDMCGFGHLKSRTWSAPVHATTPEVTAQPQPHRACCWHAALLCL